MKKTNDSLNQAGRPSHHIPDIEIVDLETVGNDFSDEDMRYNASGAPNEQAEDNSSEADAAEEGKGKKRFHLNMHIVLLAVVLIFIAGIAYKISHFGVFVDLDEIFQDGQGTYDDSYDEILPLMDADGNRLPMDLSDGLTIVAFGNAPFADDRDDADGLLNLIADQADATVYNCSVTGSYMAASSDVLDTDITPMDVYSLYWMAAAACGFNMEGHFTNALSVMGDDAPADARESTERLFSIDFSKVDVITIMYDATDYFMGNKMYDFNNTTDVTQFAGNLEASIEMFQQVYPGIRIIVLGAPYAFAIDEDGNYISSDMQRYGQDVLSVYSIMEWYACSSRSVTFVDNLYGTITEDNAKHYLTDNLHLNKAGRKKVAERFLYALNYFNTSE